MRQKIISSLFFVLLLALSIVDTSGQSMTKVIDNPPMGSPEDIAYAKQLWSVLESVELTGQNAKKVKPIVGAARPHGWILELLYKNITVGVHTGFVVVKKNYDGRGVSVASVEANRAKYLSSITVMFQREKGYDEDNKNWFWVKYKPDGSLYKKKMNTMDVAMAGRILKGKTREENGGCIYCHSSAGGGDYIFYPEIIISPVNN